jgi:putative transposase
MSKYLLTAPEDQPSHVSMSCLKTVKNDTPVIDMLNELAEVHPTGGFDWYYRNLRNKGLLWNRKRALRIYRTMNLKLPEFC